MRQAEFAKTRVRSESIADAVATSEAILIVGGGISGMTAALHAGEGGKDVMPIEESRSLGGRRRLGRGREAV